MSLMRRSLITASQSRWLREHAPRYGFMRRTVKRFMPGETAEDAIQAAQSLESGSIHSIFTRLGENITDRAEAEEVVAHYLAVQRKILEAGLATEISVKLTQLGLDLDAEFCHANLEKLIETTPPDRILWVDMEQSPYVDVTLELYRRARKTHPNVGVCVQAYLYRTERDIESLAAMGASVRLVKGAYNEPAEIAFPLKRDVDRNYEALAKALLEADLRRPDGAFRPRAALATHDVRLIGTLTRWAAEQGIHKDRVEIQMLYGIQRAEQTRLAREGYRSGVLVAYGTYWFPWFMRRLAERPANVTFLARNLFS
ncbi:MAG TPA: proline dehydrogenase family protein [Verrucomicrobiae bacterium]|nr:proline dehydrogenase family protein [Verrucomicrobiae bacterium]